MPSKQRPEPGTRGPAFPDVASLGYEQARDELVSVVARLETGADSLEESLALWERGEALAARCQEWLDGARARLAAVREDGTRTAARSAGATERPDEQRDDAPDDLPDGER